MYVVSLEIVIFGGSARARDNRVTIIASFLTSRQFENEIVDGRACGFFRLRCVGIIGTDFGADDAVEKRADDLPLSVLDAIDERFSGKWIDRRFLGNAEFLGVESVGIDAAFFLVGDEDVSEDGLALIHLV